MWERAGKKLTKDSAIAKMIDEMSEVTNGTMKNLTNTMAFKGSYNMTAVQDLYVKSLDTAARMAIRTACSQLAGKISMRNCQSTGTDLVEVPAHWGAREDHAVWQGKIYSISGKNKKYQDFAECRYGEVDGLKGVICRHEFYPFFEGISEPTEWPEEPSPKEWNGKTYTYTEATQKQRQMERNVRAIKREIEAQNAIGGDTNVLEAKKRRQISEYHEFSNAMEIRPKDNRLIVNPGSSNITNTKAYGKYRRTIDKSQEAFDELVSF